MYYVHQVNLVATYTATLPVRQRRNLYANFLRSLEGDEIRREALELAEEHMAGDVPAILKQVDWIPPHTKGSVFLLKLMYQYLYYSLNSPCRLVTVVQSGHMSTVQKFSVCDKENCQIHCFRLWKMFE